MPSPGRPNITGTGGGPTPRAVNQAAYDPNHTFGETTSTASVVEGLMVTFPLA